MRASLDASERSWHVQGLSRSKIAETKLRKRTTSNQDAIHEDSILTTTVELAR